MAGKMLQFTKIDPAPPEKRAPSERRTDFAEIARPFTPEQGATQASRCEQCGIPFCQSGCPVQNNIPDWLMLCATGRMEEAYAVSQATNNFPEICGRICPQDRLCEGICVLQQSGHGCVTIGAVEKHITDTAWANGWVQPATPERETGISIGVVGAGPGGLAAAEELRRAGHAVTVYDRHDRAGGLLIYGIPGFKLEKDVVTRRVELLAQAGVTFRLGFAVGRDATLEQLRQQHQAMVLATGVYKARDLTVPGAEQQGVVHALDYLTASNRADLGETVPAHEDGSLFAKGKAVVVIGGGDTAMDCVRTAIRQGATRVTCLYRRDRANMPGSQREVAHAEEEGVTFEWLAAPEAVLGEGHATGVRAVRMQLGMADESGRRTPVPVPGSEFVLEADLVIKALGFEPEDMPATLGAESLGVSRRGTILIDPRTRMTNLDGVFAVGDVVRGASLVVWAIRDGRDTARAVETWLAQRSTARSA